MANISRVDVNNIAATYLRDRVNGNFNPYRQGWHPNNVNTGLLDSFSNNPGEATPSQWLGNTVIGSTTRQLAINLGNYYSRVMYCRYGVVRTNYANNNAQTYYGWFAVNTAAAGAQAHRNTVASQAANAPALVGNVTTGSVASCYDYLWTVIWNNRHSHEVDLMVCHNSYVAPPHSSRGRR